MSEAMFEVMSKDNSATITLYDMNPGGACVHPETWIIRRGVKAIARATLSFAKKHGLEPEDVGYSVVYEDEANG
jgi:hypothetical protein